MAFASGIYGPFLRDMGNNDKAFDLSADTIKWQTTGNAYTPNFDTNDEEADLTDEITGPGYTTGGEILASSVWGIGSGFATFTGADVALTGTSLPGVYGVVFLDDTLAGDPLIAAMLFAGAPYTSVGGPFEIEWHPDGIWRADYAL